MSLRFLLLFFALALSKVQAESCSAFSGYDFTSEERITALGNEGYNWEKWQKRGACEKDWTILVYMAADNDLTPFALADIYEMEAAFATEHRGGSTFKTDLLVELSTKQDDQIRRLHIFQGPTPYDRKIDQEQIRSWKVAQIKSPIVQLKQKSMETEDQRFRAFLRWGVETYPSRHYMVVVWGHGQGWTAIDDPLSRERKFGGLAFDESGGFLSIPQIRKALENIKEEQLFRPIDIYLADACLMQMAEVSYELSGVADYIVGSPQIQNNLGLPYRRILYELNSGHFNAEAESLKLTGKAQLEPYLLSLMIPELFLSSMNIEGFRGLQAAIDPYGFKSLSMSSISSSNLAREFVFAWNDLAQGLLNFVAEGAERARDLQLMMQAVPSFAPGLKEVGIFLGLLQQMTKNDEKRLGTQTTANWQLQAKLSRVDQSLKESILKAVLGDDYLHLQQVYTSFRGMGIWLPISSQEYLNRRSDFQSSQFFKDSPHWDKLLQRLFAPNDATPRSN